LTEYPFELSAKHEARFVFLSSFCFPKKRSRPEMTGEVAGGFDRTAPRKVNLICFFVSPKRQNQFYYTPAQCQAKKPELFRFFF